MRVEPLGDRAYILRDLPIRSFEVANWLNLKRQPGLIEAVASYDTVGLYVEPGFDPSAIEVPAHEFAALEPLHHRIPVCYLLGEDLTDAAAQLRIGTDQLIEAHSAQTYTCHAVGFCPGFAYLGHLTESISGLPRKSTPRTR